MPDTRVSDHRLELLLPIAEVQVKGLPLAPRLSTLRGKTIGFVDDHRWALGVSYKVFEELLYERHEIAGTIKEFITPGEPLTKEQIENLASKADAVIYGLGY